MLYNQPTGGAANDPYVGKNVAAGIQGSKIPPGAAEFPQREIIAVITAAGLVPTNSDLTQLLQAIRKIATATVTTNITNNYAKGSLIGRRVYSTPGTFTYTPTPGTASIRVIVQAAGGSGGSTQATGPGQYALAGGGASGGRADSDIANGFSGQSVIVGSGGSGNANGLSGSAGGSSSFGNLVSATGGQGGAGSPPGNTPAVQAGGGPGYGSGGNVANIPGAPGLIASGTSFTNFCSGGGAASTFGGGGTPIYPSSGPGNQGYGYGSGGSGAGASANMPILAGGSGANGCVIIEEFD